MLIRAFAHVHSSRTALAAGACLQPPTTRPALRTGLVAPAWRPALCVLGESQVKRNPQFKVKNSLSGIMGHAPSRGPWGQSAYCAGCGLNAVLQKKSLGMGGALSLVPIDHAIAEEVNRAYFSP